MSRSSKTKQTNKTRPLPPYILIEDDVDIGNIYAPVNVSALAGGPHSHSEILAAMPKSDRLKIAESLKEGYSAVLIIDVKSGLAGLEMRRHVPPGKLPKPTRAQADAEAASNDCSAAFIALEDAVIRQAVAMEKAGLRTRWHKMLRREKSQ